MCIVSILLRCMWCNLLIICCLWVLIAATSISARGKPSLSTSRPSMPTSGGIACSCSKICLNTASLSLCSALRLAFRSSAVDTNSLPMLLWSKFQSSTWSDMASILSWCPFYRNFDIQIEHNAKNWRTIWPWSGLIDGRVMARLEIHVRCQIWP